MREVKEEIGIEIKPQKLLCIDYTSKNERSLESLQFIFFGGILTPEQISEITIPTDEISTYQFLLPKQALPLMSKKLSLRVNKCLKLAMCDRTLYLEDQEEQ
jgi:8-oxo-dGTP diphosphatase